MKQKIRILTCMAIVGFPVSVYAQEPITLEQSKTSTSIGSFINYIWSSSPAVESAEAKVIAAEAGRDAASKWQYNPEIGVEVEDVDGEDKTKLLGLSQTIDWSGKSNSAGKTAYFELLAVKADRDQVRQDTALDVISSLAEYKAANDIYNLAVERSKLMERFATLAKRSFKAGDIDKSEKNLAQLALSEALIVQAEAETSLAESKQALDSSIGFVISNDMVIPELPESLPQLPDIVDAERLLMKLPHIQAIRNRENVARASIAESKKNRLPDPTIGIVAGKDTGSDMIGFSVSVPLNVLNSYGAEVDKAKAEALAEAKAGQSAFHSAKTRLEASMRSYKLSRKGWDNWQKNGAQALAEQADILDRKFKVGDLSATDYLVQIEQALDTQVAAEELHNKVWQSWFAWLRASGTINQWIQSLEIQNSGE